MFSKTLLWDSGLAHALWNLLQRAVPCDPMGHGVTGAGLPLPCENQAWTVTAAEVPAQSGLAVASGEDSAAASRTLPSF